MAEYLGRTSSCTAGTKYPDHNLTAYAKEQGQETAILGVVFDNCGDTPKKIYSYWGHTGCKVGRYAKVLVPRMGGQAETTVKIVSVLPATGIKEDNIRTCKHMQEYIGARPRGYSMIRSPKGELLEAWRNHMCAALLPMPKTKHAKKAVETIDGMFHGIDPLNGDHQPTLEGHASNTLRSKQDRIDALISSTDDQIDGLLAYLARERKLHKQDTAKRTRDMKMVGKTHTGWLPMSEMPVLGFGSCMAGKRADMLVVDELYQNTPNQPKETTVSTKIETITYVTLPGSLTGRRDVKTLKAEEFFAAIGALEKEVARLEGIKNQPRTLQERVLELNQQITELSTLCDQLHAAKPAPNTESTEACSAEVNKSYGDGSLGRSFGDAGPGSQA